MGTHSKGKRFLSSKLKLSKRTKFWKAFSEVISLQQITIKCMLNQFSVPLIVLAHFTSMCLTIKASLLKLFEFKNNSLASYEFKFMMTNMELQKPDIHCSRRVEATNFHDLQLLFCWKCNKTTPIMFKLRIRNEK